MTARSELIDAFCAALLERPDDFSLQKDRLFPHLIDRRNNYQWDVGSEFRLWNPGVNFDWLDQRRGRRAYKVWRKQNAARLASEDESYVRGVLANMSSEDGRVLRFRA